MTVAPILAGQADAGPEGDGAVTQLMVDPVASGLAGWAARRKLSPAALYGMSLGLGLLSALWFSEVAIRAEVVAVAALLGALAVGRAGGLLASAGREGRIRPAIDWLGAASGLLTEFAVYAALAGSAGLRAASASQAAGLNGIFGRVLAGTPAASWGGSGPDGVWRLAVAAMLMLAIRRIAWLCCEAVNRPAASQEPISASQVPGPASAPARRSAGRIVGQVIALPTGERFALIAVTAVFFGPRLTFLLLLAWGALAAGYALAGQIARSARPARTGGLPGAYRGDGVVSLLMGDLVQGRIPPLLPVLPGLLVTCVLVVLGLANLPGVLILAPVMAMLLVALGAWHPHDGRLDWLAPALLVAGECLFLAALGFARHVIPAVVFALLAGVIIRHADLAYRARVGRGLTADVFGLGWDGRILVAGVAALAGLVPFAYAVVAGYLWLLCCWEFLSGWLTSG
jgi:Family of unknown function (DUF5941)